jgi:plastocyanin
MRSRLGYFARVTVYALVGVPVALAVVIAAAAVAGGDVAGGAGSLPAFSVVAVVMAAVIILRRRVGIVIVVITALVVLGSLIAGSEFALRHPEDFPGFVGGIAPIAAFGVAAFAGFKARRRRRRNEPDEVPSPRTRRALLAVPAIVAVLVIVSAVVSVLDEPVLATAERPAEVVTEHDRFVPWEFVVVDGERAEFVVENIDDYAHTFTIDELEIDQYLGPRADRRITIEVDHEPGTLKLYCAISGHESMVGTVTVE